MTVVLPLALLFLLASAARAAAPPAPLVAKSDAFLYARPDEGSERIAALKAGEPLTPVARSTGAGPWYLVRSEKGAVGWVKAAALVGTDALERALTESREAQPLSTWAATTTGGRTFSGTWTGEVDAATGRASGTWTLEQKGKAVMSGTWSAVKSSAGWQGAWAAQSEQGRKYAGTWSTKARLEPNAGLAELFKAAAEDAVGGEWKAGGARGSWSIRVNP